MKHEHYLKLQGRKTVKYGSKQHHEMTIVVPAEICRLLDLVSGNYMRLALNEKHELIYTKANEKPPRNYLTYERWLTAISKLMPRGGPGKTYAEICREAGIPHRSAPALWVRMAERDIGLVRNRDRVTRRVLWMMTVRGPSNPLQILRDTKLTDIDYIVQHG
jgi:hypothetical protein